LFIVKPIICHIKENSFLARLAARRMKSPTIAMVIGHTIHLYGVDRGSFLRSPYWVRHEVCHVMQYRELGVIAFLWQYLWECKRVGYYRNHFEVAARAAENNAAIMNGVVIV
jgi:hypothetical protein